MFKSLFNVINTTKSTFSVKNTVRESSRIQANRAKSRAKNVNLRGVQSQNLRGGGINKGWVAKLRGGTKAVETM